MIPNTDNENNSYPDEWEAVLARVEILLATGYPRQRLQAIAGLPAGEFESLLQRGRLGSGRTQDARRERALQELSQWLADEDRERSQKPEGHAETPTFIAIQGIIERARRGDKFYAVTGGVGVGKSDAAIAYAAAHPRTHQKPGAVRVEFKQSDRSSSAALAKILGMLVGEYGSAYRSGHLLDDIGKVCRPGDILILDECNELGDAAGLMRNLWDSFKIPIVAMGNPDFDSRVYGRKSTFGALANRMLRYDFPATTEADVDAWFVWAGLSGAALRKVAVGIAAHSGKAGGLRSLALLVDECRQVYNDQPITADMLSQVARQLGRPMCKKEPA